LPRWAPPEETAQGTDQSGCLAALLHLIEQLAQLTLKGGQIETPVTPAAGIDLTEQPEPIRLEVGDQLLPAALRNRWSLAGLGHGMHEDGSMQALFSPGSLVTIAGASLSVIGWVGYATGNPNLSLPTIFYGIPILLAGLALKSSELPPPQRPVPPSQLRALREQPASEPLRKLLADVCRWRYGQKAHLESSLEVLKLWDDDAPPQLLAVEELDCGGSYGLRLRFSLGAVPLQRWQAQQQRLGRFFGSTLRAEIEPIGTAQLDLRLLPLQPEVVPAEQVA
jgi:hypothetical protein